MTRFFVWYTGALRIYYKLQANANVAEESRHTNLEARLGRRHSIPEREKEKVVKRDRVTQVKI